MTAWIDCGIFLYQAIKTEHMPTHHLASRCARIQLETRTCGSRNGPEQRCLSPDWVNHLQIKCLCWILIYGLATMCKI
jgi:hypothetical protein